MSSISALARPTVSIDFDPSVNATANGSAWFYAGLKNGSINSSPSPATPEPASTPDVSKANKQLVDGVNAVKQALSQVNYDVAKQQPDIVDDVGFHYGGHKLSTESFKNSYKDDGSIDKSKPYIDNNSPQQYDSSTSSAWDFTVENGQFRVHSKLIDRSQLDWVTKGESSSGDHTMVQAVSKEQIDVIQKSLNGNKELMQGVKNLLNGIQGSQSDIANAPSLMLKQLLMDSENINVQEAGRDGRDYQSANNAEIAGVFRRVAVGIDPSLQVSSNINTFA